MNVDLKFRNMILLIRQDGKVIVRQRFLFPKQKRIWTNKRKTKTTIKLAFNP